MKHFNAEGMAELENRPKAGRPVTHTKELSSQVIDLAVQKPNRLGYPFTFWTLRRLQAAVTERYQLHFSASTIWEWLGGEGLEWKRQQSWFRDVEQHDLEFVEKGAIVCAYVMPLPRTRVMCIDEWRPLAVKTYPGAILDAIWLVCHL